MLSSLTFDTTIIAAILGWILAMIGQFFVKSVAWLYQNIRFRILLRQQLAELTFTCVILHKTMLEVQTPPKIADPEWIKAALQNYRGVHKNECLQILKVTDLITKIEEIASDSGQIIDYKPEKRKSGMPPKLSPNNIEASREKWGCLTDNDQIRLDALLAFIGHLNMFRDRMEKCVDRTFEKLEAHNYDATEDDLQSLFQCYAATSKRIVDLIRKLTIHRFVWI